MDMNLLLDMALSMVFTTLRASVKNKKRKEELKRAMLKLRNTINLTYAGDDDFAPPTQA